MAQRGLAAHLGQSLNDDLGPVPSIDAEVRRLATGQFEVSVVIASDEGDRVRVLQHHDCGKLTEAALLVIALAILPATSSPAPEIRRRPAPPSTFSDGQDGPNSDRALAKWLGVGAAVAAGSGQLPNIASGLNLWLEAANGMHLYGALGFKYFVARSMSVLRASEGAVRLSLVSADVRACLASLGEMRILLCVMPELGVIRGVGTGLDVNRSATARFSSLWLGLAGDVRLSQRVSLMLGIDSGVAAERPKFAIDGVGDVFRPDRVSWVGWVGLVVRPLAPKSSPAPNVL